MGDLCQLILTAEKGRRKRIYLEKSLVNSMFYNLNWQKKIEGGQMVVSFYCLLEGSSVKVNSIHFNNKNNANIKILYCFKMPALFKNRLLLLKQKLLK